ncbi:MAG: penicillin-binding protein 1B [Thiothrix sp.]|nr:MAG: penicillin-binding protein 1B [Thiothrix sp.]
MVRRSSKKRKFSRWLLLLSLPLLGALCVPYVLSLNHQVTNQFEGKRWQLPARVYARPLDLFPGQQLSTRALESELAVLNFRQVKKPHWPGEYSRSKGSFTIVARAFRFPDEYQPARTLHLQLDNGYITQLEDGENKEAIFLFRLEPVQIAKIYPNHNEDRVLVKLEDVPELLVQTLLAIEDQDFYHHYGVQPKAIFRAMLANFSAGRTVQGGSTLTQQLVKNFFLSNERTLMRKLNEAIMALLLEWHYDKDEILEAYLNEIYLGQDGARSIHGFGLASQFYFQRNLKSLPTEQLALLVGLAKGASYYDPRRRPERAKARRNVVIAAVTQEGLLDTDESSLMQQQSLGVTPRAPSGITSYPSFLQLVRKQLRRDYRDEDLQNEGLAIFTTLDPYVQSQAELSVTKQLKKLEKDRGMEAGKLQGALLIASVEQGEVLAVVGGRDPRYAGFNRALDMRRPVGSAIKPAVFLTALSQPSKYNLLSLLVDSELVVEQPHGTWEPKNYNQKYYGQVTMLQSLSHSLNTSTVRLGMALGVDKTVKTLEDLGIETPLKPYPSLLLGAVDLPPIELLQMYQTIAAGGYKTPLRAILTVIDQSGETLQRYPLTVEQAVSPQADYLLMTALHEVTTNGTGRALKYLLPKDLKVAGKTGTTNNSRDSWFAGFSASHVAVAWVGRDDNQATGLTGSSGALRVWAGAMNKIDTQPLQPLAPDRVEWALTDIDSGTLLDERCQSGVWLPFISGSVLPDKRDCPQTQDDFLHRTIRGLFH